MRNLDAWIPTKIGMDAARGVYAPAARAELAPGSILMATLVARWYADVLPRYARGTMLDVGCGKVPFYGLYAAHVGKVLCSDWPGSLHGAKFIDFAADLNGGIPLQTASVDTVLASDVLEHIYRPQLLLSEIFRILRPGGCALLNMPFLYWVHEAPHDFYRYTKFAVRRMALDSGFDVARLDSVGGGGAVLADLAGKLMHGLPLLGDLLARTLQRAWLLRSHAPREAETFPLFVAAVLRKPAGTGLGLASP